MIPGATIRKPRENFLAFGWRTALTVCHAISIAITVVLPAPVASFSAMRISSGLAAALAASRCVQNRRPCDEDFGATSVSQMTVSTASTWQKNGFWLAKSCVRQCRSSRAVEGVTCHWLSGSRRQLSTADRMPLITSVGLYSCPSPSLSRSAWIALPRILRGFGIGDTNALVRRRGTTRLVGWPFPSSSQCCCGSR